MRNMFIMSSLPFDIEQQEGKHDLTKRLASKKTKRYQVGKAERETRSQTSWHIIRQRRQTRKKTRVGQAARRRKQHPTTNQTKGDQSERDTASDSKVGKGKHEGSPKKGANTRRKTRRKTIGNTVR